MDEDLKTEINSLIKYDNKFKTYFNQDNKDTIFKNMIESEYFSAKNKDFNSFFNKNNKITSTLDMIVYIISLDSINNNNNNYTPYNVNLYLNEMYVFLHNYDNIKKHITSVLKENENINDTFLEKLFNNILFITYLKFKICKIIKKQIKNKNLDDYIQIINVLNDTQIDLEKLHSDNKHPTKKENKLPINTLMNPYCEFIRNIFLNKNLNEIKKDMDNLKEFKFIDYKEYTQLINKYDNIDLNITADNIKQEMLDYTFDETEIDFNKMNENFNKYDNKIFDLSTMDCKNIFFTGYVYILFTISNTRILNKDSSKKIESINTELKIKNSEEDIQKFLEEEYESLLSSINHIMKEENITLKENFKNTKTDVFIEFLKNLKLKIDTLKNKTDKIKNLNNKIEMVLKKLETENASENTTSNKKSLQKETINTELEKKLKEYENKINRINLEKQKRRELKETTLKLELLQKQKELEVKHTNVNPMSSEEKERLLLSQSYNNYSLFPYSINHKSIYELENEFKLSNFDFDDESILTNGENSNFKGMVNELCQKYSKI